VNRKCRKLVRIVSNSFRLQLRLLIFAITIPFDIRDYRLDTASGLLTFPVWLGVKGAKVLALVGLAAAFVCSELLFVSMEDVVSVRFSLGMRLSFILSYLFAGGVIWRSHPHESEYFYAFWIEGTMIFQTLLVLAVSQAWPV